MNVKVFLRDDDLTWVTPQLQQLMSVVKKHKRCLVGAIFVQGDIDDISLIGRPLSGHRPRAVVKSRDLFGGDA